MAGQDPALELRDKPGPWIDLALTLPVFLAYHAGVVFLRVQNATDVVTGPLLRLAEGNREIYLLLTAAIGVVFSAVFAALGRGHAFRAGKFVQIAIEGMLYAALMRLGAGWVTTKLFAMAVGASAAAPASAPAAVTSPLVGVVMSMGAGFYEELAFRVLLFGVGTKLLVGVLVHQPYAVVADVPNAYSTRLSFRGFMVAVAWAVVSAAIFSLAHYVGALGDSFAWPSFVFRMVLGLVLTLIFVARGFAAAVWAHACYDVWVLALPLV